MNYLSKIGSMVFWDSISVLKNKLNKMTTEKPSSALTLTQFIIVRIFPNLKTRKSIDKKGELIRDVVEIKESLISELKSENEALRNELALFKTDKEWENGVTNRIYSELTGEITHLEKEVSMLKKSIAIKNKSIWKFWK